MTTIKVKDPDNPGQWIRVAGGSFFWRGTKAEYDALPTKDPALLYVIEDASGSAWMTEGAADAKYVALADAPRYGMKRAYIGGLIGGQIPGPGGADLGIALPTYLGPGIAEMGPLAGPGTYSFSLRLLKPGFYTFDLMCNVSASGANQAGYLDIKADWGTGNMYVSSKGYLMVAGVQGVDRISLSQTAWFGGPVTISLRLGVDHGNPVTLGDATRFTVAYHEESP
jgi:hypothetical protein